MSAEPNELGETLQSRINMNTKEIPGTLGFLASDTGRIFTPDLQPVNTYYNGDGYITASIKTTDGSWVTFGVQRLVALAHIPSDIDVTTLAVNHRDGVVTNNHVNNLEWVTNKLNNIHAALMCVDNVRPRLLASNGVEDKLIANLHEASLMFNRAVVDLWDAIKDKTAVDGWMLTHIGTKANVPATLRKDTMVNRGPDGRPYARSIKMLDVLDNRVINFDSLAEAAREFGTSASHIHQSIHLPGTLRLYLKRYLVVYQEDEFPIFDKSLLEDAVNRGSKEVRVINNATGKEELFESAAAFIRHSELSKKAVTTRLRANVFDKETKHIGDWSFSYF